MTQNAASTFCTRYNQNKLLILAKVAVIGDVMGPALLHMDKLVVPTNGGEPSIARFAPSTFLLKYLDATGQAISAAGRARALRNLKLGTF